MPLDVESYPEECLYRLLGSYTALHRSGRINKQVNRREFSEMMKPCYDELQSRHNLKGLVYVDKEIEKCLEIDSVFPKNSPEHRRFRQEIAEQLEKGPIKLSCTEIKEDETERDFGAELEGEL